MAQHDQVSKCQNRLMSTCRGGCWRLFFLWVHRITSWSFARDGSALVGSSLLVFRHFRTIFACLLLNSLVVVVVWCNTTFWEPLIGLVPCVVVKCPGTTDGMPHPWLMLTSLSFTYGVPTIICHAGWWWVLFDHSSGILWMLQHYRLPKYSLPFLSYDIVYVSLFPASSMFFLKCQSSYNHFLLQSYCFTLFPLP